MKTPGNEQIEHRGTSIIIRFPGPRSVLSTSWLNGGHREDLTAVFNHQIPLEACEACHSGASVKEYLEEVASSLSLDPASSTGLITRAEMKNAAIVSESFRDLAVTAVVTAGVDKNGGRAGDPASYYEIDGQYESVGGTINILLIINAALPEYAINTALITATEAKVVALQQLMAKSMYSSGIATGSGTDMMCIISNLDADLSLTDAGKHSKLGELIGKSVIRATTAALKLETGLSPESQQNVLVRLSRFGVTEEDIWNVALKRFENLLPETRLKENFVSCLREKAKDPELVALVSAVLHIVDEIEWNLLPEAEAKKVACRLIRKSLGPGKIGREEMKSGPVKESILQRLDKAIAEFIIRKIKPDFPE